MNLNELVEFEKGKNFLKVRIIPNSSKNELIKKMDDNSIKIRIRGIPENGEVNKELIKFLSKELSLKNDAITIISGATSRNKLLKIDF